MENPDVGKVIERLLSACRFANEQELGLALGFKQAAFALRKKRNSLPKQEIDNLIEKHGLNPQWVYEGRGAMYLAKGFGERVKAQAEFDEGLEKFRLNARQHRYMRGLLMAYWEADEGLLKERLDASEQLSAEEQLLVSRLRHAPAQLSQAVHLLGEYCAELAPKAPALPKESAIPDSETARMKPAERRRYLAAKQV